VRTAAALRSAVPSRKRAAPSAPLETEALARVLDAKAVVAVAAAKGAAETEAAERAAPG